MCDRPVRWLTDQEKRQALAAWDKIKWRVPPEGAGGQGYPDPDIVPWCDRLNEIRGVCTIQSCAGHVHPDGSLSSGVLWLRLSKRLAQRFDARALDLAGREGIEQVARLYAPWGQEVVSVTFAGNEHNLLAQSMGLVLAFFEGLAHGA